MTQERGTTAFFFYVLRAYPLRTAAMTALLLLAGLAEGVGILTLLPVLEVAVGGASGDSLPTRAVNGFLDRIGLEATLAPLLGLVVLALTLKAVFRWLAMRQVGYAVARVSNELRIRLIRALMGVRWSYFTGEPAGHFANAVGTEAHRASHAYLRACSALASVIQVAVYATAIVLVSWRLAVVAVVVGTLITALLGGFVRISRAAGKEQTAVIKSLVARLTDVLHGIKAIKAMGRERQFLPLLERESHALMRAEQRQVLAHESLLSVQEPLLAAIIAVFLYGAVTWGNQPFAPLLVMVFLLHRIAGRFHSLQQDYQGVVLGESAFWSLHDRVRAAERESERSPGARRPPPLAEGITLVRVTFAYGDVPVLAGAALDIPAGRLVAIVGRSGAGKTTIVDLVAGLHRPTGGRILVDGVPLDEIELAAWRGTIGYVPQEMLLLNDTVAHNVNLGHDALGAGAVERALRDAGAWDFVARLERGIDTMIGERGLKLSAGQRQRIAIARALVGSPKLLILDEATSALDSATEAAIFETLRGLRGRVTVLAIAHRGATDQAADVVYEITDGLAVELRREADAAPAAARTGFGDRPGRP